MSEGATFIIARLANADNPIERVQNRNTTIQEIRSKCRAANQNQPINNKNAVSLNLDHVFPHAIWRQRI